MKITITKKDKQSPTFKDLGMGIYFKWGGDPYGAACLKTEESQYFKLQNQAFYDCSNILLEVTILDCKEMTFEERE